MNFAKDGGDTSFVLEGQNKNNAKFSIDPNFISQFDKWDGKNNTIFNIGTTSEVLQSIGVENKGIIWYGEKISKIIKKHDGMTRDIIRQVPEILENPIIILKSQHSDSRLAIFGEVTDANGVPVTAILELQPTNKGGEVLDLNVIASAYGKTNNLKGFIEKSDLLYLDRNKNRTNNWLNAVGLQLPSVASTTLGSIGSITYQDGKVKIVGVPYNQYMQNVTDNTNKSKNVNYDELENKISDSVADGIEEFVGEFGKIGQQTFNDFYYENVDKVDYLGGFTVYYEAGKKGEDINTVKGDYADNLNSAQKKAAYLAGKYDGQTLKTANVTEPVAENSNVSTAEGNKLVRFKKEGTATTDNDVAGFIENENSSSFSLTEKRMLDKLARALRVKIMISDDVRTPKGKEAEGSYGRSIIRISKNSENPLLDVLKHEVSHRVQELAPKEFNKFKKYVMKYGKRIGKTDKVEWDTAEVQNTYLTKAGQQHGNEGAMDEIVSDFAEFELMLNEDFINDVAQNEPDLAKTILNWIKDIIATVKETLGIAEPSLERAQKLWENAIRSASKKANKIEKNPEKQKTIDKTALIVIQLKVKDML